VSNSSVFNIWAKVLNTEQFTGSTVKWERVPDSRGANNKGFGWQCQWCAWYSK